MNTYADIIAKCDITTQGFTPYVLPSFMDPKVPVIRRSYELRLGELLQDDTPVEVALGNFAPFATKKDIGFFKLLPGSSETRQDFVNRSILLAQFTKDALEEAKEKEENVLGTLA